MNLVNRYYAERGYIQLLNTTDQDRVFLGITIKARKSIPFERSNVRTIMSMNPYLKKYFQLISFS